MDLPDDPPRLSFIVPAHNEEYELPATLPAIRRAAEHHAERYEIIVVDDASTDRTGEIARRAGARVISINRRQIAAARNAGGRAARGEILFFVDADTHVSPTLIGAAIEALGQGCIGGSARVSPDRELPIWGTLFLRVFATLYFSTGLGAGAFLFTRRESFNEAGGFDEQYFAGEEVFFSLALKKLGRFVILREPFVTSARKLRMHSPALVARELVLLCLKGQQALRNRDRLGLWYDGKREGCTRQCDIE
jgi:glycosyltransferase involved in cell wall biosynthesis